MFVLETLSHRQNNRLQRLVAIEQLEGAQERFAEAARAYLDTPPPATLSGNQGEATARNATLPAD